MNTHGLNITSDKEKSSDKRTDSDKRSQSDNNKPNRDKNAKK